MGEFIALLLTALAFIMLDLVWFSVSLKPIYEPTFQAIQGSPLNMRIGGGIVAWVLLALGVRYFGLADISASKTTLFLRGAVLGFIIYGVYNGTNYATFSNYPVSTAIADTMWGTFVTGVVTIISSIL